MLAVLKKFKIHGIAHVTGGAFYEKLTKVLPKGYCFEVQRGSWVTPHIFETIQKIGNVKDTEMFRTFNMGIGMVLVTSPKDVIKVRKMLKKHSVENYVIGKVIKGTEKIRFV